MKPLFLGYDAKEKPIRLKPDDRKIHMHVLGSSGSGKSRFLEWMIRGDLKNRQGFCLVDPHGELYDSVVAYAARYALDRDIVLLNAAAALVADSKPAPEDLMGQFRTQLVRAEQAVDSGAGQAKLEQWVQCSQRFQ